VGGKRQRSEGNQKNYYAGEQSADEGGVRNMRGEKGEKKDLFVGLIFTKK